MTFDQARAVSRPTPQVGEQRTFYSTAVANPDVTPWSGQRVTILDPAEVDIESEPAFRVRAADGHEFTAFQGELDGFYFDTGQYVGHSDFGPSQL